MIKATLRDLLCILERSERCRLSFAEVCEDTADTTNPDNYQYWWDVKRIEVGNTPVIVLNYFGSYNSEKLGIIPWFGNDDEEGESAEQLLRKFLMMRGISEPIYIDDEDIEELD